MELRPVVDIHIIQPILLHINVYNTSLQFSSLISSSLVRLTVCLHGSCQRRSSSLAFGCLNIRSLNNKLDDLLEVRRDQAIDVLCLVETWHDADSVCIRRLRMSGDQVVDKPRPRNADDLSVNHGGVAIVAGQGIRLSPVTVAVDAPSTFEYTAARTVDGSFAATIVVVYRPGSQAVQWSFYDEFAALLEVIEVRQERVFIVGDHQHPV